MPIPSLRLYTEPFDLAKRNWADNERRLVGAAQAGEGLAQVFVPPEGIVVPRSYRAKAGFGQACAALSAEGLPVHLRLSGGGVVPQSAHTINVNLAYRVDTDNPFPEAEAHYLALCGLLQRLLAHFGITACCQTVAGSFCDGRFNLAVGGRKIAGTAQYWQRGGSGYTVLSHAVIVAGCAEQLTGQANRFERALGGGVRYLPEKTVSVQALCGAKGAEVKAVLEALLERPCLSESVQTGMV